MVQIIVEMNNPEESKPDYTENWLYEKKALRDTCIRNIHEMEELKRGQEMRVDEFSVHKLRESHATIQELTSQKQELQRKGELYEWFNRISRKSIDLQCKIISRPKSVGSRSKFSIYVELRPKPAT